MPGTACLCRTSCPPASAQPLPTLPPVVLLALQPPVVALPLVARVSPAPPRPSATPLGACAPPSRVPESYPAAGTSSYSRAPAPSFHLLSPAPVTLTSPSVESPAPVRTTPAAPYRALLESHSRCDDSPP